jgi:Ner family transcriptional regulator
MASDVPMGWHQEDIKAALRKRYGSLTALSTSWGLHKATVAVALNPGSYIPTVERRIAEALDQHPHTLWPDRWTPEGTPRSAAERNLSPAVPGAHRPNRRAA